MRWIEGQHRRCNTGQARFATVPVKLECFALKETAFRVGLLENTELWIRDSSALRPIQCILPAMFQIGGFMPSDQFHNAGPEP